MNDGARRVATAAQTQQVASDGTTGTALSGVALLLARLVWAVTCALAFATFVATNPALGTLLGQVCTADCLSGQLTPGSVQALQALGVSIGAYAVGYIAFNALIGLVCWVVSIVLVRYRPRDWMAQLVAIMLILWSVNTNDLAKSTTPFIAVNSLGWIVLELVLYLFPNGRFVPRWMRWVALCLPVIVVLQGLNRYFPDMPLGLLVAPGLLWPVALVTILAAQVYRYRYVSDPVQQQQTKWVVFGVAVFVIGLLILIPGRVVPPGAQDSGWLYHLLGSVGYPLLVLVIPLSIAIAILRSNLWDIDLIIRRTLIYGVLTTALVAAYISSVILLETLLRPVVGENNDVAIVISTLAIAALFNPLRTRIQAFIDRRFYRRKYDAARTLASFSAALRDEVDLDNVAGMLVQVVNDTMQPSSVSLWLLETKGRSK